MTKWGNMKYLIHALLSYFAPSNVPLSEHCYTSCLYIDRLSSHRRKNQRILALVVKTVGTAAETGKCLGLPTPPSTQKMQSTIYVSFFCRENWAKKKVYIFSYLLPFLQPSQYLTDRLICKTPFSARPEETEADTLQSMACLYRHLQTDKTVADCQCSCRRTIQLQTINPV